MLFKDSIHIASSSWTCHHLVEFCKTRENSQRFLVLNLGRVVSNSQLSSATSRLTGSVFHNSVYIRAPERALAPHSTVGLFDADNDRRIFSPTADRYKNHFFQKLWY